MGMNTSTRSIRGIRKRAKTNYISEYGIKFLRGFAVTRCRTDEPGCAVCDYWHFYRTKGRFPVWTENDYESSRPVEWVDKVQ